MRLIAAIIAISAAAPAAAEPEAERPIGAAVPRLTVNVPETGRTRIATTGVALQLAPLLRQTAWWRHAVIGLRASADIPPGDFSSLGRLGGELGYYRDSPAVAAETIRFGLGAGALVERWSVYRETEGPTNRDGDGVALGVWTRGAIRVWRIELAMRLEAGRVVGDSEPLPINGNFTGYAIELGVVLF